MQIQNLAELIGEGALKSLLSRRPGGARACALPWRVDKDGLQRREVLGESNFASLVNFEPAIAWWLGILVLESDFLGSNPGSTTYWQRAPGKLINLSVLQFSHLLKWRLGIAPI